MADSQPWDGLSFRFMTSVLSEHVPIAQPPTYSHGISASVSSLPSDPHMLLSLCFLHNLAFSFSEKTEAIRRQFHGPRYPVYPSSHPVTLTVLGGEAAMTPAALGHGLSLSSIYQGMCSITLLPSPTPLILAVSSSTEAYTHASFSQIYF